MNEHIYIILAYAVLVFIFLFCGILRSCNLFPHAIKDMEEFYPARKLVTGIYFSVALLLPCALYPESHDAQLLARCFWIVYIPLSASLAFRLFFQTDRGLGRKEYLLTGGIPAVAMLTLFAFALAGGNSLQRYGDIIIYSTEVISIALTAYLVRVTLWIWNMIRGNEYLIPRRFALGIFWLPLTVQIIAWGVHLADSAFASATFAIATALVGAMILVVILRPQRIGIKEERVAKSNEKNEADTAINLSVGYIDKMERQVREVVERDQMYLKPDFTKTSLATLLGINDLYLHVVLRKRFGPFNTYINTLRIEYALRYEEEHPDAKREELATVSGFGSVRTYYRAKTQYLKGK